MSSALPIEIIRGRSKVIDIYLTDEEGRPIDLTAMTEFKCKVHATTGVPVEISLTGLEVVLVGSAVLGHVQAKFTSVKTALMGLSSDNGSIGQDAPYSDLQIEVTLTGNADFNPLIEIIDQSLNIIAGIS